MSVGFLFHKCLVITAWPSYRTSLHRNTLLSSNRLPQQVSTAACSLWQIFIQDVILDLKGYLNLRLEVNWQPFVCQVNVLDSCSPQNSSKEHEDTQTPPPHEAVIHGGALSFLYVSFLVLILLSHLSLPVLSLLLTSCFVC